jgi:hypothetical protein
MGRPMPHSTDEEIEEWLKSLPPTEIADLCNYTFNHWEIYPSRLNGPIGVEKVVERAG